MKVLNKIKKITVALALCALSLQAIAQTDPLSQAKMYYDMQQYDKAIDAFEDLYSKDKKNNDVYAAYLDALIATKNYKKADKLINDRLKLMPGNHTIVIDLGHVTALSGKEKAAEDIYEQVVKSVNGDDMLTQHIAQKFTQIGREDYALKTYEYASQMLSNQYMYSGPMSQLYFKAGDIEKGVITLLSASRSFYNGGAEEVKSTLLDQLGDDKKKLARAQKAILKKINDEPDNTYYAELLTWLYTQKGDWEGALIQARALDERFKEQGQRLLELARYANKEGEYEYAVKAFDEVLERGKDYPFYSAVVNEKLNVQFKMLQNNPNYTPEDVAKLEKEYQTFLDQFPQFYGFTLVQDYAMLEAQYANKADKAVALLEKALEQPQASKEFIARTKLQLGDYYILTGKIWDASLIYTQVQKAFREDILGEEARFRDARLAYYRADFDWANLQLNVLKASTSELIANDALYLSVLITENISSDSNYVPLQRFAAADLLLFQNKDAEASRILDSVATNFKDHPLQDDILMKQAKIAEKHREYDKAMTYLKRIHGEYGKDVLADDALFAMAEIQEKMLNKKDEAAKIYSQLIIEYPGSTYVQLARKKVKELEAPATPL